MKEMVAGCCVCSDERGWTENPLVYCDGIGCNIGVHQACYGITAVPDGNWYCRKCESQERSARVRCELCPSKDGALKRTDTNGWAHVVCGLYIPEVRFGSVTTMEPIVLSQIPTERYNKVCYICEQNNRGSRASMGACMQCNKAGCKQQFHVTCAQAMGLLCEEAGNYLDNVKYCGYCQEHYNKLKKGANVKTIPAYRPSSSNNSGSEDSPEKKLPSTLNQPPSDPKHPTKRKSSSNRPASQNGPPRATPADKKETLTDHLNGSVNSSLSPSNSASLCSKNDNSSRFTTSNFVESVITPSESVFADMQKSKKRKLNEQQSSLSLNMSSTGASDLLEHNLDKSNSLKTNDDDCDDDDNDDDSPLKFIEEPNLSAVKTETLKPTPPDIVNPIPPASVTNVTTVIYSTSTTSISSTSSVLPSVSSSCTFTNPVSSSYLTTSAMFTDAKMCKNDTQLDKGRSKQKRSLGSTNSTKKSKISNGDQDSSIVNGFIEPSASCTSNNANMLISERPIPSQSFLSVKSESGPITSASISTGIVQSKESPPTSPENSMPNRLMKNDERADKEMKTFQTGSSAPHMLGNQLNPASSMAQKMSDALNDELEAHSIFTTADVNSGSNSFVGPPLYNKIISTTRATDSSKRSNSPSNGPLASLSGSAANFPQSLEELLETQWEQGGTFLMEQAQHFDIASLLTCLHKLREENLGLEESIRKLKARRDHLLGVNARLAMPLAPISQPVNNVHTPSQTPPQQQQQHSTPMSQTITQQSSSQPHHGQQMSHVSPPSQLQQVPLSTQQKQSANLAIGSLPPGISDPSNSMRSIPHPPASIYATSCNTSTALRGPHGTVYQNTHSLENGLLSNPTHHQPPQQQHSRGMSSQANAGTARHLTSASNQSIYNNGQPVSNQGVVVRTSNLSDVSRTDRRNTSVVSSNYQSAYQMSSLSHQQQS